MLRDGLVDSLKVLFLVVSPKKITWEAFANHLLALMGTLGLVDRLEQGLQTAQALAVS